MASSAFHQTKRFVRRHFGLLLVVLFIILIGGTYLFGFRPGPGLTFVRVGTLVVDGIPNGTAVYVDQASRGISSGASLSAALVPGNHTVIVDPPGDEPWEKTVLIASSQETHIAPMLVAKKPASAQLTGADAAAALALQKAATIPTALAPLTLGCQQIYVSDNRVIAAALPQTASTTPCAPPEYLCTLGSCEPTVVYSPIDTLRSVIPVLGRTDAIIVSVGEWAYVLGLDPRSPQYFAPLTHGIAPVAVSAGTSSADVIDSGAAYRISF